MKKDRKSAAKANSRTEKQNESPPPEPEAAETAPGDEAGADIPPPEAEAPEPTPEDRIATLEAEVAGQKDQLLRALAEVENTRRRAERDRQEASRYAATGLARDLLSVADNLRRALESLPGEAREGEDEGLKNFVLGVELTEKELLGAFAKHTIEKIDPLDQPFDHTYHQAMFELADTGKPAGTVVQVLQAGYRLRDRLLRPAMVGVAKGEPAEIEPPEAETAEDKGS